MADAPKPPEVKRVTILDQLKKLDDQRATLLEGAKQEALDKAEAAVNDLNALGFSYRLVEGAGKATKSKGTRQRDPDKPCGVCKFATEPPHDGRAHKNKQKKPAPFTADELKQYGYKKKAAA